MASEKPRLYFLLILLGLSLILSFLVLRPFLYSLILALVFAIVFQPLYKQILKRAGGQTWLAALLTIIILIIFILIPIAFLVFQIFQEAQGLYISVTNDLGSQTLSDLWPSLSQKLTSISPLFNNLSINADQYVKNVLSFLVQNLGIIFSNLVRIFVNLFVFLIAFFFLLKDGDKLKKKIVSFSPLAKDDDEAIAQKITQSINSVIKGSLLVATLQGISCSVGLLIFGVPNPIMWGTLAAIGALVPGVGTTIVLIPAIIYLYLTGQVINMIGLLAWGILAVGLIDNFLGPRFVGKGAGLHPLLILLSVLGGLSFFGPIGFILGPLTISLLLVLLDIYASIFK
ncbi:MAG: AI-2E family transporter [Candidatus Paceibacterota bacterium]|jgi:predicted PurR-regulated permease PerM